MQKQRIVNVPKANESNNRVLGFVVDSSKIPVMGLFEEEFEEECINYLRSKGYVIQSIGE